MDIKSKVEIIKKLESFEFSIEEYARDNGLTVSNKAIVYCGLNLKSNSNIGLCNYVIAQTERIYRTKIAEEAKWMSSDSENDLKCEIAGKVVEGRAKISPKQVVVYLSSNPKKKRQAMLLPLAPVIYTIEPYNGSPANERGIARARMLFLMLYFETLYYKKP